MPILSQQQKGTTGDPKIPIHNEMLRSTGVEGADPRQGDRKGPHKPNWVRLRMVRGADPRQGDRKGPHPAPHHSRPYNDYERGIT